MSFMSLEQETAKWVGKRITPIVNKLLQIIHKRGGSLMREAIRIVLDKRHKCEWYVGYIKCGLEFHIRLQTGELQTVVEDPWLRTVYSVGDFTDLVIRVFINKRKNKRWAKIEYELSKADYLYVSGTITLNSDHPMYKKLTSIVSNRPDIPGAKIGQYFIHYG